MSYGTFALPPPTVADAAHPSDGLAREAFLLLLEVSTTALAVFLILIAVFDFLGLAIAPSTVLKVCLGFTCLVLLVVETTARLWRGSASDSDTRAPVLHLDPWSLKDVEKAYGSDGRTQEKVGLGTG
jgi:hypothetical protein